MKAKVYSLIILLLLSMLSLVGCTPGPYTPPLSIYYVATNGNNDNDGSSNSPWATIQYALDAPSEDSFKVILKAGTYNEYEITFPGDKEIYLLGEAGPNATIIKNIEKAGTVIRISNVLEVTTIEGVKITGGNGNNGGGIFVANSNTIELTNCMISNNSAAWGGGIFSLTSPLLLNNCTISDNFASGGYGGIGILDSSITLWDCTISNNSTEGDGGGIYTYWKWSTISLINCNINNNSAGGDGGGIYLYQAGDSLISNNLISNNSASDIGGGIYIYEPIGTISIFSNTVCNNASEEGTTNDNQIIPNNFPSNTISSTCSE